MLNLQDLAIIMVALAAGSVAAGRMKLSAIPLFIIVGVLLGPLTPFGATPLQHTRGIEIIAELGVILLLFFLGLEFSLERLKQARRLVVVGGLIDLAISATLGVGIGLLLFGPGMEVALFTGIFAISSSGIVTQALFDLHRLADDETDLTLGILVFEDIAVAIFLAIAGTITLGGDVSPARVTLTAVMALAFITFTLVASHFAGRIISPLAARLTREQLFLCAVATAVGGAYTAELASLSEAVGALLAGVLLSGADVRDTIEHHLMGLRDFAAAIFFFAFGLSVELGAVGAVWQWMLLAVPAAIVGKIAVGYIAGRVTGFRPRASLNVGAALVARGEFSIIVAQMAAAGAAINAGFRADITAFAGMFVLSTAIVGVVFMSESKRVGRRIFPGSVRPPRRRATGAQRHG